MKGDQDNEEISIHALREEGDRVGAKGDVAYSEFLSTPSARRATREAYELLDSPDQISIHALREEGDIAADEYEIETLEFLSTPSARRATTDLDTKKTTEEFLSTPSARRATTPRWPNGCAPTDFYPRPPRGGRLIEESV